MGCLKLQVYFPSVTVCNQNRVDCSALSSTISSCTNDVQSCGGQVQFDSLNVLYNDSCDATGPSASTITASTNEMGGKPPTVEAEQRFLFYFMSLNEDIRKTIGHDFTTFIKSCTFGGYDCLSET